MYDKNGCHVIQLCIERALNKDAPLMLEPLIGRVRDMAMNKYSCHVIQKVVEFCQQCE